VKYTNARFMPRATRFTPLAAAISSTLAASFAAQAQQAPQPAPGLGLDEIVVTAQKRSENLQSVPISIQAIDSKKLADLQVASFDDYAKYLPSLSVQSYGPSQAQLYVRGVTNGGDGVHVGSQPLVGLYLDEMPVTTIAQNLDVHIYDVARVEALSGPQGTLFGASSMSGTLRIITNKPDLTKTESGFDVTGEYFTAGDPGGKIEGFVNFPVGDTAAIRLVGWSEHDGGYINVVRASPQYYPTSGVARDNAQFVEKNSNYVDTAGGRAALKVNLGEHWTVTPTLMTQSQTAHGQFAYTPYPVTLNPVRPDGSAGTPMTLGGTGDLNVARFGNEINRDNWWMGTLVVEGKIAALDLTYAGGYIKRDSYSVGDYSDYSLFYDVYYSSTPDSYGNVFVDKNGKVINPAQTVTGWNHFTKQSHELRLATPTTWKVHGVVGYFWQRQYDDIQYHYSITNLSPAVSVDGQPGTLWYEKAYRTDRDRALFTDWTWDLTSRLALTGGVRAFHYDNTIDGFFGFGLNYPNSESPYAGENLCFPGSFNPALKTMPCQNLDYRATKSSETHRVNLTYKFDDDRMAYATWSTGFRPGGINRSVVVPPYNADYLANFELGAKTSWFEHRLRLNGALFYERWKDAQFAYPGPQGVNIVINAGRAAIKGVEGDLHWRATEGLTLSTSATFLDAKLLTNVCHRPSADLSCSEPGNEVFAPTGSRLPVSSKFKGNMIARYEWSAGDYRAHAQAAAVYQSDALAALRIHDQGVLGSQPGYGTLDVALGVGHSSWTTEFYVQNLFDKRGESIRYTTCATSTCQLVNVIPVRPRLVGLTFGERF
jgi:iron complex outermembrane receptor protein